MENLDISPERVKMATKRDSNTAHGEARHVVPAVTEEEWGNCSRGGSNFRQHVEEQSGKDASA